MRKKKHIPINIKKRYRVICFDMDTAETLLYGEVRAVSFRGVYYTDTYKIIRQFFDKHKDKVSVELAVEEMEPPYISKSIDYAGSTSEFETDEHGRRKLYE